MIESSPAIRLRQREKPLDTLREDQVDIASLQEEEVYKYCTLCCFSFPVNSEGVVQCFCINDDFTPEKFEELDFND